MKPSAILKLVLILSVWAVTVLARFWIHADPGEAQWFMWVLAQGFCAAGFGFMLARIDLFR